MALKRVIRSITPPLIYQAAYRIRRSSQPEPGETIASPHPATLREFEQMSLEYRHALALENKVPELKAFGLTVTRSNAAEILRFYNSYIPLIRVEARGAHVRTLLAALQKAVPQIADQVADAIARSDLADGIPDRAQRLTADAKFRDELARQTRDLEMAYGAEIISQDWRNSSRGASLLFYLQSHPEIVTGKDVLHIAAEEEARAWLAAVCRYKVLDGSPDARTDVAADITDIPIADESFDIILCHRVLEHIVDDRQAMRELHRILRRGGILNLSVPQAAHRAQTAEWLVQDGSHDQHVRHYGQDLVARLEDAGFEAALVPWLLEQPGATLRARNAYPLRMFNARKRAPP